MSVVSAVVVVVVSKIEKALEEVGKQSAHHFIQSSPCRQPQTREQEGQSSSYTSGGIADGPMRMSSLVLRRMRKKAGGTDSSGGAQSDQQEKEA